MSFSPPVIFKSISKLKEKFNHRFTPAGRFFLFVFFISTVFGLNPEKSMLYQVGIFSISLLFIALLFTIRFNSNIEIKRRLPETCLINKETTYTLIIINKSRRKISGFSFKEVVDSSIITSRIQNISDMGVKETIEIDAIFLPKKRGYVHTRGVYIFREDPLGLLRKQDTNCPV